MCRVASRLLAELRAQARRRQNVVIGRSVRFGPGVRCVAAPGSRIVIGNRVEVGGATTLTTVVRGAELVIGDDVFISGNCVVAAERRIEIGPESMLAEVVSIRDHDHDPAFAPRKAATLADPVSIGARVWIGAKVTIVRGASIGDDAVVGANALVRTAIPPGSLAAGVPAQVKRREIRSPQASASRAARPSDLS